MSCYPRLSCRDFHPGTHDHLALASPSPGAPPRFWVVGARIHLRGHSDPRTPPRPFSSEGAEVGVGFVPCAMGCGRVYSTWGSSGG